MSLWFEILFVPEFKMATGAVCTQCCWQPMQIIVIHQKRYGFFQNEILQKMRHRHRDVGIGTFCRGTFCNILTNLNVLIDKSYD